MRERVGIGAAPCKYRMNLLFRHGFRTYGRAGGLSMHLGGRAHASADAVQRFRAVRVGVGQTGEALAERFGYGVHLAGGRQDSAYVLGER